MMDMKGKAIEKLMSVLDEVLGEDVSGRVKKALASEEESPEMEESEEEGMPPSETGEEVASGGAAITPLPPYPEDEEDSMSPPASSRKGVGIEASKVKVAELPRSSMMKKMRGNA